MANELERGEELGRLEYIDEPQGVSWLDISSLVTPEGISVVPVPTDELKAAKGEDLVVGDLFWALVNIEANTQSDVIPSNFLFVTKEKKMALDRQEQSKLN